MKSIHSDRVNMRRWAPTLLLLLTPAAGVLSNPVSAAPVAGADTFKSKCAMCHGPDGSGATAMGKQLKVRDLRSAEVQKQSDDQLSAIISNGKPPMPAYGKSLTAEDIRKLVAYLRSIASKG